MTHRPFLILSALHLAQTAILLAMPIPHLWKVPAQFSSGYVPPDYPIFITTLIVPLVLAPLSVLALVAARRGILRWPIGVDIATAIAAWTILVIYVFSSELPIVLVFLAPANLVVASAIAWRRRRPRHRER